MPKGCLQCSPWLSKGRNEKNIFIHMAEVSNKSTGRKLQKLAKSAGQKTNSMTKTKFQTELPKTDAETPLKCNEFEDKK